MTRDPLPRASSKLAGTRCARGMLRLDTARHSPGGCCSAGHPAAGPTHCHSTPCEPTNRPMRPDSCTDSRVQHRACALPQVLTVPSRARARGVRPSDSVGDRARGVRSRAFCSAWGGQQGFRRWGVRNRLVCPGVPTVRCCCLSRLDRAPANRKPGDHLLSGRAGTVCVQCPRPPHMLFDRRSRRCPMPCCPLTSMFSLGLTVRVNFTFSGTAGAGGAGVGGSVRMWARASS